MTHWEPEKKPAPNEGDKYDMTLRCKSCNKKMIGPQKTAGIQTVIYGWECPSCHDALMLDFQYLIEAGT